MSHVETDRELLDSIRRDDPGAFEEFVRIYGGRIYAFGMRVCGEREDAKDVAQDTLMKAFHALKDVNEPRALRSWIYRVVSNACLMQRRKGKYEPRRELALEELMPQGVEDAEIQIPDAAALPDDEVAVALDITESAVKMRLHRARLMLRNVLAERLGQSPSGKGNGS